MADAQQNFETLFAKKLNELSRAYKGVSDTIDAASRGL